MVYPKSLYLGITLLLLPSCGVDVHSTVPDAPVYYEIDFASSEAASLRQPSGYLRIEERSIENSAIGFGGLLVVHSMLENGVYYAYDLACPHEVSADVLLFVNDQLEAECPQCHSTYSILYGGGGPTGGPTKAPLRSYATQRTSRGLLIYNRY